MAPEDIKKIMNRKPFLPMRMHLSNGITHDLMYPDAAAVFSSLVIVGKNRNIEGDYFDEPVFVDLRSVVQLEPILEGTPT